FIDDQLVPKPVLHVANGPVKAGQEISLTASANATIYYTLDGTDPRLAQGGISTNAVAFTGPIQFSRDSKLVARAHDPGKRQRGGPRSSTPWSGPVAANVAADVSPRP